MQTFKYVDMIVPIPMTKTLTNRRLTNHAEFISKEIQKAISKPIHNILEKNARKSQKSFSGEYRRSYIKGKITLKKNISVNNKSILLVDDVLTTGATIREGARILKKAGAREVVCFTLTKDILRNV